MYFFVLTRLQLYYKKLLTFLNKNKNVVNSH
ncbi:hypothetical protein PCC7418_3484 [Halothece sp. PCC 7418]|nr:hypothetical protein PCC7418_3484 [Halothece sp. PCC 7418]